MKEEKPWKCSLHLRERIRSGSGETATGCGWQGLQVPFSSVVQKLLCHELITSLSFINESANPVLKGMNKTAR